MARGSRSNKKQPAFDPSELQDLIFSPAVGTGVGSHLLEPHEDSHSPKIVNRGSDILETPTVGVYDSTTVDMFSAKKERTGFRSAAPILQDLSLNTKVSSDAKIDLSTVVIIHTPTVGIISPVCGDDTEVYTENGENESPNPSTVDTSHLSIVNDLNDDHITGEARYS